MTLIQCPFGLCLKIVNNLPDVLYCKNKGQGHDLRKKLNLNDQLKIQIQHTYIWPKKLHLILEQKDTRCMGFSSVSIHD